MSYSISCFVVKFYVEDSFIDITTLILINKRIVCYIWEFEHRLQTDVLLSVKMKYLFGICVCFMSQIELLFNVILIYKEGREYLTKECAY